MRIKRDGEEEKVHGHLEYGYGMGCDVRDMAQRNRVIAKAWNRGR